MYLQGLFRVRSSMPSNKPSLRSSEIPNWNHLSWLPIAAYKYDATVEITPEIEDIDYKGLSLERTLHKVSDSEVDVQLKTLQQNMARQQKISDDRPAQDGDFVLIDFEGSKDGDSVPEFAKTENFSLQIGKSVISEDFDSQLSGMKAGGHQ